MSIFKSVVTLAVCVQLCNQVVGQFTGPTLACGGTSLLKTTTLISPAQIGTNGAATSCSYNIRAINLRVCQLRLDFNSFNLAPPTVNPYPACHIDTLSIANLDFNLCGENSGQHIYVPFSPTLANMTLAINFNLGSRIPGQVGPYWNVRVQQLECPVGAAFASKAAVRAESLVKTFHNDLGELAPTGCLQYHTTPTGIIKSFNFNNGGPYIGNMNYAICFRRTRANSSLKLFADVFDLAAGDATGYDSSCYSNIETPGRSEDYLLVPEGVAQMEQNVRANRFCGQSLHQRSVESSLPGPFALYFNSDSTYGANGATETGFQMSYQIV
ncbi:uncharacterized protein LOC109409219 [Aedes albopictus]|uniref:CUB domain-containing protein n=1 Tax=Aedes albopictus TaxID=7160 RepID=A0ABM1Z975_AEDAL|nr:uncharacterized protein LOC109409219 [Aedes albopictus]XP_029727650.1 uncharacterized protein LOC115265844 [Aedes albopictus]